MNTAVINIKTSPETKFKAKKLADEMGFSLSSIVNAYLKQFVRTRKITFKADEEEPNEYMLQALKESKEDIKRRRVSPAFDNAEDAITWLNSPHNI